MYVALSTLSLKMVVPQQIEFSNLSFWFSISLVCYIGDSSKWFHFYRRFTMRMMESQFSQKFYALSLLSSLKIRIWNCTLRNPYPRN